MTAGILSKLDTDTLKASYKSLGVMRAEKRAALDEVNTTIRETKAELVFRFHKIKPGVWVREDRTGRVIRVDSTGTSDDLAWMQKIKPWVSGPMRKKDGTLGRSLRFYDSMPGWEIVSDEESAEWDKLLEDMGK